MSDEIRDPDFGDIEVMFEGLFADFTGASFDLRPEDDPSVLAMIEKQNIMLQLILVAAHEVSLHVPEELMSETVDADQVREFILCEFEDPYTQRFVWHVNDLISCVAFYNPSDTDLEQLLGSMHETGFGSDEEEIGWLDVVRSVAGPLPFDGLSEENRARELERVIADRRSTVAIDHLKDTFNALHGPLITGAIAEYSPERDDHWRLANTILRMVRQIAEHEGEPLEFLKNDLNRLAQVMGVSAEEVNAIIDKLVLEYKAQGLFEA